MTNLKNLAVNSIEKSYDEVPYESYPYELTKPYHLMTLGVLFGMSPTTPEKARVLELGCASGGNLIPHAVNYPEAEFIGVDLSKVQIDEANKNVKGLGLKNIKFQHCSVTDINESWGKFDYIIAHGLLSWVPDFVRNKIFEICDKNLSQNGIACISYNALPGWNMVRSVREMLIYHTRDIDDANEKLAQAKRFIEFLKNNIENSNSLYAEVIAQEIKILAETDDFYLVHEHLEENNKQFYFYEIIKEAKKNNLQYLADSQLFSFDYWMPLKEGIGNIAMEQYKDFINYRRFKYTLLCHEAIELNRNIDIANIIIKFNIWCNLTAEKPLTEINIKDDSESLNFFYKGEKAINISASNPHMKAILYVFAQNHVPLNLEQLIKKATNILGDSTDTNCRRMCYEIVTQLAEQGYLAIALENINQVTDFTYPKLPRLPLYQIKNSSQMWVTNLRHNKIIINELQRLAMLYMDGSHTKSEIIKLMTADIRANNLCIKDNEGKLITSPNKVLIYLTQELNSILARFNFLGLLI